MSRPARAIPILLLLITGWFTVRAVEGWAAGTAWSNGRRLAARGDHRPALAHLRRAAVGHNRAEALWLRGQVRLGLWQNGLAEGRPVEELWPLLLDAYTDYTEAIAASPAQGWFWVSLGDLYHQMERVHRHRFGFPLELMERDRWALVGREGRVAIGLTRQGLQGEPFSHAFWDQLALMLWDYGLREPALAAVRRAAAALPIYRFHTFADVSTPPEILDAFIEGSREAVDGTPFLRRALHLIALARIELRRDNPEQAEQDARRSLESPGEWLNRAEATYWLGLALTRQGRYAEAGEQLTLAGEHPAFEASSLAARARIAELEGRLEEALPLLLQARRKARRRLQLDLDYARIASLLGEWTKAEEALRWAALVHPRDPNPRIRLAETYLESGQRGEAKRTLAELERMAPDDPGVVRLREVLSRD